MDLGGPWGVPGQSCSWLRLCVCVRGALWIWALPRGPPASLAPGFGCVCFAFGKPCGHGRPPGGLQPVVLRVGLCVFAFVGPGGSGRRPGAPRQACSWLRLCVFAFAGPCVWAAPGGHLASRARGLGCVFLYSRGSVELGGPRGAQRSERHPSSLLGPENLKPSIGRPASRPCSVVESPSRSVTAHT